MDYCLIIPLPGGYENGLALRYQRETILELKEISNGFEIEAKVEQFRTGVVLLTLFEATPEQINELQEVLQSFTKESLEVTGGTLEIGGYLRINNSLIGLRVTASPQMKLLIEKLNEKLRALSWLTQETNVITDELYVPIAKWFPQSNFEDIWKHLEIKGCPQFIIPFCGLKVLSLSKERTWIVEGE